jgi:D-glycero-beta-D-manno-heptose 1-phosphate adenylyltransferase
MKTLAPHVYRNVHELTDVIKELRGQGKSIVTTNGCFDIVHTGHVAYLTEAASFGDILIVGINSDKSVQQLKGPTRPLQKEHDRTFIISSLKMVDYAFIFEEKDPIAFLSVIKPDIHVKGGDYTPETLPERKIVEEHGGRIAIVSFVNGYSTTSIVKKMGEGRG